jgi:hypothetical protein
MKANKFFLTIGLLTISIAPMSLAVPAQWCGNISFLASQSSPYANNPNCYPNSKPNYTCMQQHVNAAAVSCLLSAKRDLKGDPGSPLFIANYKNLSMYFYGVYDHWNLFGDTTSWAQPSPNVNVTNACGAQGNAKNLPICAAAYEALLNPYFIVPRAGATPPPPPEQTADECYTEAYNNANALFNLQIQNLKTGQAGQNPNNIVLVLGITAINAKQQALQTNCNGSTRSVAGCTQHVQLVCTDMQKSTYTYCTNLRMSTFIVNCQ